MSEGFFGGPYRTVWLQHTSRPFVQARIVAILARLIIEITSICVFFLLPIHHRHGCLPLFRVCGQYLRMFCCRLIFLWDLLPEMVRNRAKATTCLPKNHSAVYLRPQRRGWPILSTENRRLCNADAWLPLNGWISRGRETDRGRVWFVCQARCNADTFLRDG